METIRIAHLYYDLMNLYGESGNVRVLIKHLENQNLKVVTHFLTVDDEIDFEKYDIFYIGCGNTENFFITLQDLNKYQNQIKKAIDHHKFFLITGNALNLFGKYYIHLNGKEEQCLDILDYDSEEIDFRIVGEQVFSFAGVKEDLIGFQNRDTVLRNVNEPHLFEVKNGTGYLPKSNYEGVHENNFYGTYLLGPVLARNPHFTEFLVKEITNSKNVPYKKHTEKFEVKAYQEYIKNIVNE